MVDFKGQIVTHAISTRKTNFFNAVISYLYAYNTVRIMDNDDFDVALKGNVNMPVLQVATNSMPKIDDATSSQLWGITPEMATRMISCMMQL